VSALPSCKDYRDYFSEAAVEDLGTWRNERFKKGQAGRKIAWIGLKGLLCFINLKIVQQHIHVSCDPNKTTL